MRRAGMLLPLFSLPSPGGIGTLGAAAYQFVDFLRSAGQSLWQILPVGHTGYGHSPYQCYSAFAGNPWFVDLDLLAAGGLLTAEELAACRCENTAAVNYDHLQKTRLAALAQAAARQDKAAPHYRAFCAENAAWLDDYALFMAVKEGQGGAALNAWPDAWRQRGQAELKRAAAQFAPRAEFWRCVQYFFRVQWDALKAYANAQGVLLVGDIPIYVAADSADVWAHPALFQLDAGGRPQAVAGVPPDAFCRDGQLWGNPLYSWRVHRATRYAWWVARLRQAAALFDITRIDHFRGFAGYYAVPAGDATAENGVWRPGPGAAFIRALRKNLPGLQIIAEDLGFLSEDVFALLAESRYPGMKVLQFAFDSREESDYLPHNYPRRCVVYTGTHDNPPTAAWAAEAKKEDVAYARRYWGVSPRQPLARAMVYGALRSVADDAVIPVQDWLGLGAEARVNTPATVGAHNWSWRLLPGQLTAALAVEVRRAARAFGRLSECERLKEEAVRTFLARRAEGAALHAAGPDNQL